MIATDAGHWYDAETGDPRYTVLSKNGIERKTTVRDARKDGLVPSVTTILKLLPKPLLVKWLQEQILYSALTLKRNENEADEDFKARIFADADEQSRRARERGSRIHGYVERFLLKKPLAADEIVYATGAINAISDHLQTSYWDADSEKSFASPLGYGGKVDLHSRKDIFVCDFKTKEFDEGTEINIYNEHKCQLVAYAHGLGIPEARLINVFISTTVPGLARAVEMTDDREYYWQMFRDCLSLFKTVNRI